MADRVPSPLPERASGILLHPTSLPGPYGSGDLGRAAHRFLDWLVEAGQSVWQVLPLGPAGPSLSPYDSPSAFAGNPRLIAPDLLVEEGLLQAAAVVGRGAGREALLREAWRSFRRRRPGEMLAELERFVALPGQAWLDDWALFAALGERHAGLPWTGWPPPVRDRRPAPLAEARAALAEELDYRRFVQFLFHRQWQALRDAADRRGILLFGDLPFYVAHDSADVWCRRELFDLEADGRRASEAGVPPDDFAPGGQLWGTPTHRWERHAAEGYRWWVERLRVQLERTPLLRLDHFRGFVASWRVPLPAESAAGGEWRDGPGRALFDALREGLGSLPFVAEDLGHITEEVVALRDALALPGTKVLQFGFGDPPGEHAPERIGRNDVVYTGTHDNDTARGWLDAADEPTRGRLRERLPGEGEPDPWRLLRAALESPARLAIAPLQDVLGLGSEARMNTPGQAEGCWRWRAARGALTGDLARKLRRSTEEAARLPCAAAESSG